MIRLAVFLAVAILTLPALAQSPADPARTFEGEWSTIVASDLLSAAAHKHTGELAEKLVADYRAKLDELKKAKDDLAGSESRLATAIEWLKIAQAGAAAKQ